MELQDYTIRNAKTDEFGEIGNLMIEVYSLLDGFPSKSEQPQYYQTLARVGEFTGKPGVELLVAVSMDEKIIGAVVYFGNVKYYGSDGIATKEINSSGFRLLAVDPLIRGRGIGKALAVKCIEKARAKNHKQMIIHTTQAMQIAWKMYESLGFRRSEDLDFNQGELPVLGFRLLL